MNSAFPMKRPRVSAPWVAIAALLALAAAGCDSKPTAPEVPLPPLSRVVISFAGDTTVTADTLNVNATASFAATVRDTGNAVVAATVNWFSTDAAVFTVNANGLVTGRGEGTAWLIVTVGNVSDSVAFLVLPTARGWIQQTSNSSRRLNGVFVRPDGRFACAVGDGGEILTTFDAGVTWTRRTSNTAFNLNDVWFTSTSTGWAVGNSGVIVRTTNSGSNWTVVAGGASENLYDVTFTHPDTGWAVGFTGTILRTVDGGANWSQQNPVVYTLYGVAFSEARYGWAVGDNGTLLGTVDRGLTWTLAPAITAQELRAVATRGRLLNWASGAAGVTPRTVNNAGNPDWELQNAGASYDFESVAFVSDLTGFACGTNGTGVILHTGDGGANWTPQTVPNGTPLNAVFFVDGFRGWAVGDNGRILHTSSGGEN